MKKKKIAAIIMSAFLTVGIIAPVAYAKTDSGNIDLYEVFSDKNDRMKTEVGSRIYKWSMHLPDDAIVYKSDRANEFNMSTKSYNSSVDLSVTKNKDDLTLEELLYKMQNSSRHRRSWRRRENKEFTIDIAKDSYGKKYIKIIKTNRDYGFFMMEEPEQEDEFKDYIENRMYVVNGYIYNLEIDMDGEFYRGHEEMFDKLVSSFKLSFDEKNPYIKELSDSVSTTREYKNKNYGWKIVMSPYWKVEGSPNTRCQTFCPVYSDEELNNKKDEEDDEFKIPEGITVKLVSSAESYKKASIWAQNEIEILKNNYNKNVYKILKNESKKQGDTSVQHVVIRYNTVTKTPYIVHNLYAVGNGYQYLVSATMMEDKYKDAEKRKSFEDMLNSFTLDKKCLSKYLGRIITAKSVMNLSASKELKMKKYNFKTKITKNWNISYNRYGFYYDDFDDYFYEDDGYRRDISNNEYAGAFEPKSNIRVEMSAGLDTEEIDKIIENRAEFYLKDDEIRMGLSKINIKSGECDGAKIYYIAQEYDLDAINKFVKEDKTKKYDLEELENQYLYIIKIGKDLYRETITVPVANMTSKNKLKANNVWKNTYTKNVNYSTKDIKWKQHKLEEFDKDKKEAKNK
ncbi:hypothetical protein OW763_12915 [Clostridium aestuarii]|uniref:Uncharacterized protein n=1 Tax=Clostridium aestuarii TaxID=338193 RepID=A0ABT4D1Y4_9CLOT|nr:hypothetical protein [Clostridium aestuarii]MCY6485241.1 hypothetical protein [Clostridium aestuarii]